MGKEALIFPYTAIAHLVATEIHLAMLSVKADFGVTYSVFPQYVDKAPKKQHDYES